MIENDRGAGTMRQAFSSYCEAMRQRLTSHMGNGPAAPAPEGRSRRIYSDFVAKHPDMPSWHRERFLAAIK